MSKHGEISKKPVVKVYEIKGMKYIVEAVESEQARERAETKIQRLIHNEIQKK